MADDKVFIVGVGDDGLEGLTAAARRLVSEADVLVGTERSLAESNNEDAQQIEFHSDLERLLRTVDAHPGKRIVILTSGDPLFYGTARYLCDRLGKDRFEVLPHVSSMQLAFARVKESWDEAYLTNLATQPLQRVVEKIRTAEKVGIFTTEEVPPNGVAQALLDQDIHYFSAYVCENLGSPDERVTQGELAEVAEQEFSLLNVMILIRKPEVPDRPRSMLGRRLFGNPDELFLQSQPKRGLLTPAEIRSLALSEMDLGPSSIVWDVGAGSGSIAIESAQIASAGQVFAIEMDPEDHQLISANASRFRIGNLQPILGQAPEAWEDLPNPDAIFVGGSGRKVHRIVSQAYARLRPGGRLVAHMSSIENLNEVYAALMAAAGDANAWMLHLARGNYQLERLRFESLNPTFLVSTVKPEAAQGGTVAH